MKKIGEMVLVLLLGALMVCGCSKNKLPVETVEEPLGLEKTATGEIEPDEGGSEEVNDLEEESSEIVDNGTPESDALWIERVLEEYKSEAEDGTELLSAALYYPVIQISQRPDAAEKINSVFEEQKVADAEEIAEYEEWAAEHYQEMMEADMSYFPGYAVNRDYTVPFQNSRVLSIKETGYVYLGGAHPINVVITWNFDLETGELIELEQLTDDPEGFREVLQEKIQSYLESQQLEEGIMLTEGLFPDYLTMVSESLQNPAWYVQDGELRIVFNEYEIAPYAAGIIEVPIPLTDLQEYWNEYGANLKSL